LQIKQYLVSHVIARYLVCSVRPLQNRWHILEASGPMTKVPSTLSQIFVSFERPKYKPGAPMLSEANLQPIRLAGG
jgi:hypothetical protein